MTRAFAEKLPYPVLAGPWDNEPDEEDWDHAELPCAIRRHPDMGHLCGYVGVPRGHPSYFKSYDALDMSIHGGLTYAGTGEEMQLRPGVHWYGFDTAHAWDYSPGQEAIVAGVSPLYVSEPRPVQHYRGWAYVRKEVERLAEQLANLWQPTTYEE